VVVWYAGGKRTEETGELVRTTIKGGGKESDSGGGRGKTGLKRKKHWFLRAEIQQEKRLEPKLGITGKRKNKWTRGEKFIGKGNHVGNKKGLFNRRLEGKKEKGGVGKAKKKKENR